MSNNIQVLNQEKTHLGDVAGTPTDQCFVIPKGELFEQPHARLSFPEPNLTFHPTNKQLSNGSHQISRQPSTKDLLTCNKLLGHVANVFDPVCGGTIHNQRPFNKRNFQQPCTTDAGM